MRATFRPSCLCPSSGQKGALSPMAGPIFCGFTRNASSDRKEGRRQHGSRRAVLRNCMIRNDRTRQDGVRQFERLHTVNEVLCSRSRSIAGLERAQRPSQLVAGCVKSLNTNLMGLWVQLVQALSGGAERVDYMSGCPYILLVGVIGCLGTMLFVGKTRQR